jgi:hypothetical protein
VQARARKALLAMVLVAALAPLFPALPYPTGRDDTPRFFGAGASLIPRASVALISPFASPLGGTSRPMVWQAAADDRFRMPEGYIIRPGARFDPLNSSSPLFHRMIAIQAGEKTAPLTAAENRRILCQLASLHVESIVVGPMHEGRDESIRLFRTVLQSSPRETGGVQLWPNVLVAARRASGSCA